ncbi:MAG: hypothetical protein RBT62_10480 [Spirochaetia bacterium]|nr:hypothetical protein [Spirochaetia bacterium]
MLVLALTFRSPLGADDRASSYVPIFFGLSTELSALPGTGDYFMTGASMESICLTAAIGHRNILTYPKLRVRGGFGFWQGRAFVTKLGIELPMLELLNDMQARLSGVYLYGDGIMRIGSEGLSFSAEASARLLIPLSAIGGIAVGCGYDSRYGLILHADYLAGFYAMK